MMTDSGTFLVCVFLNRVLRTVAWYSEQGSHASLLFSFLSRLVAVPLSISETQAFPINGPLGAPAGGHRPCWAVPTVYDKCAFTFLCHHSCPGGSLKSTDLILEARSKIQAADVNYKCSTE